MHNIMVEIYKNLRCVFSAEQSVYILIMELLFQYLEETGSRSDEAQLKDWSLYRNPWLCRGKVRDLIHVMEGYDIKEATLMLDELIDWNYIEMNRQAEKAVSSTEQRLRSQYVVKAGFPDALLAVLDAAGMESPITTTPESLRRLIQNAVQIERVECMAEFCCGSAGIGAAVAERLETSEKQKLSYYGEDILPFCSIFARILLWAPNIGNSSVVVRDSLKFDRQYTKKEQFDLIVADLPMGSNQNVSVERQDLRMEDISQKTLYTDWFFIKDMLYRLSNKGRALVLTTRGALIRKNEKELREWVLDMDWLEAVVTLPTNLYVHTNLERELIIFNKKKHTRGQVLFLDLSRYTCRVSRNQCGITGDGLEIAKFLADIPGAFTENSDTGALVDTEEIRANGANWNPYIYLAFQKTEQSMRGGVALGEVAAVTRGAQLSKAEEEKLTMEEGGCFLNIKNIGNGRIHYGDCPRIKPKSGTWENKYRVREDDVLIATKGTVMKCALVPPGAPTAFICGNLTIVRVIQSRYHPYVLYEYLQSENGRSYMEALQSGTTIKILNSSSLEKMTVPAYPAEVAISIGEKLKKEYLSYQQTMEELTEKYTKHKKNLIKELEEQMDEKNIYKSQQ